MSTVAEPSEDVLRHAITTLQTAVPGLTDEQAVACAVMMSIMVEKCELETRMQIAAEIMNQADLRSAVHTDPDDPMQGVIEGLRFAVRIATSEHASPYTSVSAS